MAWARVGVVSGGVIIEVETVDEIDNDYRR